METALELATEWFAFAKQWLSANQHVVGWLAVASIVTFVGSLVALPVLVAEIPADYFAGKRPIREHEGHWVLRALWHVAKNVVASGAATHCELQVAYAIGVADPVSVTVDTQNTGVVDEDAIVEAIKAVFPLRPFAIINYLDLLRPIYKKTAKWGHFGIEDPDFTWENTNKADELKKALGL